VSVDQVGNFCPLSTSLVAELRSQRQASYSTMFAYSIRCAVRLRWLAALVGSEQVVASVHEGIARPVHSVGAFKHFAIFYTH